VSSIFLDPDSVQAAGTKVQGLADTVHTNGLRMNTALRNMVGIPDQFWGPASELGARSSKTIYASDLMKSVGGELGQRASLALDYDADGSTAEGKARNDRAATNGTFDNWGPIKAAAAKTPNAMWNQLASQAAPGATNGQTPKGTTGGKKGASTTNGSGSNGKSSTTKAPTTTTVKGGPDTAPGNSKTSSKNSSSKSSSSTSAADAEFGIDGLGASTTPSSGKGTAHVVQTFVPGSHQPSISSVSVDVGVQRAAIDVSADGPIVRGASAASIAAGIGGQISLY
jgi:hypothetical protein